jgi:hypothetical protein
VLLMGLPAKRMLTAEEAAEYCGFSSVNGFAAYVAVRPVKFGKLVRYDRTDLDEFLDGFRSSPQGSSILELAGNAGEDRGH